MDHFDSYTEPEIPDIEAEGEDAEGEEGDGGDKSAEPAEDEIQALPTSDADAEEELASASKGSMHGN